MGFNFRACGCAHCTRLAERQEIAEFIDVTCAFRDIMHHNFKPDEEFNLRLLADRLQGTVTLGDMTAEGARLRLMAAGERARAEEWAVPMEYPEAHSNVMCKTEGCSNPAYRGIYCLECKGWCSA